jgi:hypothetical protein
MYFQFSLCDLFLTCRRKSIYEVRGHENKKNTYAHVFKIRYNIFLLGRHLNQLGYVSKNRHWHKYLAWWVLGY